LNINYRPRIKGVGHTVNLPLCRHSSNREVLIEGEGSSTVGLLLQTSLDQLLLIMNILFTCFTKQATLIRRSTVLSLPLFSNPRFKEQIQAELEDESLAS